MKILWCLSILLSGCALSPPITRQQCAKIDWEAFGYEHGVDGDKLSSFNIPAQKCREFGFTVDSALFRKGWMAGNREYCGTENAIYLGQNGWAADVRRCPPQMRMAFDRAYTAGRKQRELENRVRELEKKK